MSAAAEKLLPDREQGKAFFEAMFRYADPNTYVNLRAFRDDIDNAPPLFTQAVVISDSTMVERICEYADRAANAPRPHVFCPPVATFRTPRGAKAADLANGVALSVECDVQPGMARAMLGAVLGPPTVVMESGGQWVNPETGEVEPKLHLHWRLTEPTTTPQEHAILREARVLATRIVGGDATNIFIGHPMRWPGSWHRKASPKLARIVSQTDNEIELVAALDLLHAAAPADPKKSNGANGKTSFHKTPDYLKADDLLDVVAALAAIPNADLAWDAWNRIGMATWAASSGAAFSAFDMWSAKSTKYDAAATGARWEHYFTSPPTEIGAGTLFQMAVEARPGWRKPSWSKFDTDSSAAADQPIPLFPPMPPAQRYPVEALGPVLSRAAAAIANKIQVPEAIAGQSVLSVAALAAQTHADVMLPYGQARPLSLYFVTIAGSGDRKSSADIESLWPVAKREKALREIHSDEMKVYTVEHGAWSAQKKKIEGDGKIDYSTRKDRLQELGAEPLKPLFPMLTSGDITLDGLTKNMPQLPPSLGVFTAEAGQFTAGHNMSDDNRLRAAAMLSEIWDGRPLKRVRSLDGVSILPGRRLSMHLLVQPDAAADFLANGSLRDQGLLSRFLAAAPESMAGGRPYRDATNADDVAIKTYGARILTILEAPMPLADGTRNELEPRALRMSSQATEAWKAFFNHIEAQSGRRGELGPIGDFAAKVAEHAARIAGVLTIVDSINAAEIGLEAMNSALTLADWYVSEGLRLQQGARTDARLVRASSLLEWLRGRAGDEIAFREIVQFGPGVLRTKAAAEESVGILVAHGWLVETSPRPRRLRLMRVGEPP